MSVLRIRNWDKWQSYRKDRGQPPWIKLHRELMRNVEWVSLNDAQRGQLVAIWLLAADRNGVIPASPEIIRKLCFMDTDPDLQVFISKGFIEHDANVTPIGCQPDANVTLQNRIEAEKSREEKEGNPALRATEIPENEIWKQAKANGVPGSVLGKFAKQYGKETLTKNLRIMLDENPVDPVPYLKRLLEPSVMPDIPGLI